jgi:F-type H+-transporting ATPase subunit b
MEATLHQLGAILLQAIPTILLLVVLHLYLKAVFFKPIEKALHQRYEATEGARKLAQESLERAAAKTKEYEEALRVARGEIYQQQEQLHKQLAEKTAEQLKEARRHADEMIQAARAELANEAEAAKSRLSAESDRLADEIAERILRRSAA